MAVLSRSALEDSPLADLHVIAGELSIDGFRRLRKADLIDAIIARQSGEEPADEAVEDVVEDAVTDEEAEDRKPRRGRRGGRGRSRRNGDDAEAEADAVASSDEDTADVEEEAEEERKPRRSRGGRGRSRDADREEAAEEPAEDRVAQGVVELLGNGSGFLRVSPPEPSDDDVYISAAQIRRCELVSGDKVTGPVRPPRRSERYPSLIRIDTINGTPADEVSEGTPFDDLPATFPTERLALGAEDPTLKAIEWLTPLGRGSRATIVGPARAGKSEALRRLAGALAEQEGLDVSVVLAGVRPEEIAEWKAIGIAPVSVLSLSASPDAQAQAIERAVDTAKRVAARGGNAVVLVDALTYVHAPQARRLLAAARNIVDGGSLTIVATADAPVGGETTVIALDQALTSTGRFPALDLVVSGTLRPELLVGDAGADAIGQARAAALG